jgi:hypothetical protein
MPTEMTAAECADKLQESYDYMIHVMPERKRSQTTTDLLASLLCAINVLRRLAAGEMVEVAHGKWNFVNNTYFCSACGDENQESTEYCPSCRAIIDIPAENGGRKDGR